VPGSFSRGPVYVFSFAMPFAAFIIHDVVISSAAASRTQGRSLTKNNHRQEAENIHEQEHELKFHFSPFFLV
jgi:hypothetical protein